MALTADSTGTRAREEGGSHVFTLLKLSPEGIPRALEKAERYRLLGEPWEAESICRDILDVEADNRQARITMILALSDQLKSDGGPRIGDLRALVDALPEPYERAYYSGIICERQGKARFAQGGPGSGTVAYDWLRQAMEWYEAAAGQRPPGDESAILRWNTCARLIDRFAHLAPAPDEPQPMLE